MKCHYEISSFLTLQIINYIMAKESAQPLIRISIIVEFLKDNIATLDEILDHVNDETGDTISDTTLKRDFKRMRTMGINYNTFKNPRDEDKYYYELDSENISFSAKMLIDEDYKMSLPILFSLLDTEKNLDIIDWLKTELKSKYGIKEEYWENETYFSRVQTNFDEENRIKLLNLCMKLVEYMKKEVAIQFYYRNVNSPKNDNLKVIAPLHLRFYDDAYYLYGMVYNGTTFEPNLLNFKVDMIEGLEVAPAPNEEDDNEEFITFNYFKLTENIDFNTYFHHCIGVWRNGVPKTIRIKFTHWACSNIKNRPLQITQQIEEEGFEIIDDKEVNYCIISINVYDTDELKFQLAKYREFAKRLDQPKEIMLYTEHCKTCKLNN